MQKQNILIVCWDFPPNNAIGGRRWAKFARQFLQAGHQVSVIAGEPPVSAQPAWISQEELQAIRYYPVRPHFATRWLHDYKSLLKSIRIRLAALILARLSKGTIYDRTIGIRTKMMDRIRSVIIKDKVQKVFVTGAPFNLLYYCSLLKKEFPTVKFIGDYRDPWITAQNYGMKDLNPARKKTESAKQDLVLENFDYIVAPNSFLLDEIRSSYTGSKKNLASFIELPHAFDHLDRETPAEVPASLGIQIVYAGTLYIGIEKYLSFLNESAAYLKARWEGVRPQIHFYTDNHPTAGTFAGNEDIVQFHKPVSNRIFRIIESSHFILILLSEHNKNYVTSKFFEFLPYRKPYLYIGPEGFVSKKIQEDGLGIHLKKTNDLYDFLSDENSKNILRSYDIEQHSFKNVTRDLLSKLS